MTAEQRAKWDELQAVEKRLLQEIPETEAKVAPTIRRVAPLAKGADQCARRASAALARVDQVGGYYEGLPLPAGLADEGGAGGEGKDAAVPDPETVSISGSDSATVATSILHSLGSLVREASGVLDDIDRDVSRTFGRTDFTALAEQQLRSMQRQAASKAETARLAAAVALIRSRRMSEMIPRADTALTAGADDPSPQKLHAVVRRRRVSAVHASVAEVETPLRLAGKTRLPSFKTSDKSFEQQLLELRQSIEHRARLVPQHVGTGGGVRGANGSALSPAAGGPASPRHPISPAASRAATPMSGVAHTNSNGASAYDSPTGLQGVAETAPSSTRAAGVDSTVAELKKRAAAGQKLTLREQALLRMRSRGSRFRGVAFRSPTSDGDALASPSLGRAASAPRSSGRDAASSLRTPGHHHRRAASRGSMDDSFLHQLRRLGASMGGLPPSRPLTERAGIGSPDAPVSSMVPTLRDARRHPLGYTSGSDSDGEGGKGGGGGASTDRERTVSIATSVDTESTVDGGHGATAEKIRQREMQRLRKFSRPRIVCRGPDGQE